LWAENKKTAAAEGKGERTHASTRNVIAFSWQQQLPCVGQVELQPARFPPPAAAGPAAATATAATAATAAAATATAATATSSNIPTPASNCNALQ